MLLPEGYTQEKSIASSRHDEVLLARRESDGACVVVKAYVGADAPAAAARAERELLALRACAGAGLAAVIDAATDPVPVLVIEWVPGITFGSWVAAELPQPRDLVTVAIALCAVLIRMHDARYIHRNISPQTIRVDPATLEAHLTGLGSAHLLGQQSQLRADAAVSGSLRYLAPEQTGRMNRGVDPRSDLYSVGATLFEGATGRPPFDADDPIALLHAHMARVPVAAVTLREDLPPPLSLIIARLLEKEPANRYPSARALRADLVALAAALDSGDAGGLSFALRRAEAPDRPRFAARLYGRDAEIATVRARYAEAAAGSSRLLLVAGAPGAGKSALVDELRPDLAASNGYLAIGKFDLSHERPYSGWSAALGNLAQQILLESDASLEGWRSALHAGLGALGRVMVDLVPDLEFILGETAPAPPVGPRESQARMSVALRRLLSVLATPEHPVVLFLDDLQWSDPGSRALMTQLFTERLDASLLLIGAYQANEVDAEHPLTEMLADLTAQCGPIELIAIEPLPQSALAQMLADALEREVGDVEPLARAVERKTGSSPLFVRQLIEHLYTQGVFSFVPGSGWHWDDAEIAAAEIPDGAVGVMSAKLHALSPSALDVVKLASCVGDEFDVALLAETTRTARGTLEQALFELADAGLISPSVGGFHFVHDRVREAARALLTDAEREATHCDMARRLLQCLSEADRERRLLEIAEHQAKGTACLAGDERLPAAALQLEAGERAVAAGVAATAETHLAVARTLLRDEDWVDSRELGLRLYLRSAECAFLRGDFDAALGYTDVAEPLARSVVELGQVVAQRVQILAVARPTHEVAAYSIDVLAKIGVRFELRPTRLRLRVALYLLAAEIALRGAWRMFERAEQIDPARMAALMVIRQAGAVFARESPALVPLVLVWMARQDLRHGALASPCLTVACVATSLMLHTVLRRTTRHLHRLAAEANARDTSLVLRLRTEQHIASHYLPWVVARWDCLQRLDVNAEAQREAGDLEWANYSRFLRLLLGVLGGAPIAQTERRLRELAEYVQMARHVYLLPGCCHEPYALLADPSLRPADLDVRLAAGCARLLAAGPSATGYTWPVWMMVLCVFGRFDLVASAPPEVAPTLATTLGMIHQADVELYRGLTAAALASTTRGAKRRAHRRQLERSRRLLERFGRTRGSPDLVHMVSLLDAERAALRGRLERARALYASAVEGADRQRFAHHAALAAERRARMLEATGSRSLARVSLAEAARRYAAWGCRAKVAVLRDELDRGRARTGSPEPS